MPLYFLAALSFIVFAVLLASLSRLSARGRSSAPRAKAAPEKPVINCPVCGAALYKGDKITTYVYSGPNAPRRVCSVMGCPHCYPVPSRGGRRVCPVCGGEVSARGGYLVARVSYPAGGKKRFEIAGCSRCFGGFPVRKAPPSSRGAR